MNFNTEEENRNGYVVTAAMKRVWAIELDLMREFLDFCSRNNLRVWAEGGTLLGAVRHKGFIPWDNDIDLMMPREDYDRMVAIGNSQFRHPYFLQTAYTDGGYYRGHAQFRNSDTAAIRPPDVFQKFNQGIFIDVFIVDAVPSGNRGGERLDSILKRSSYPRKILKSVNMNVIYSGRLLQVFRKLKARRMLKRYSWQTIYGWSEDVLRETPWDETDRVAELTMSGDSHIFDKSILDDTVWLDFENLKIPAPARYDEFLRGEFGDDYMTPIMAPDTHGELIIDTERSYREVLPEAIRAYKRSAWERLWRKFTGRKVAVKQ